MPPHSPFSLRTAVRALACLAFPGLLAACNADAQRQPAAASAEVDDYRLTMPTLRKALPVLYAPEAQGKCHRPGEEASEVAAMSLTEMEKRLEACPVIRSGAAAQSISIRELALVTKAMMLASYRWAQEESAEAAGRTAPPLPHGALADNVAVMRQNEAELARLSKESE
jgi:hypothetical protein